MEAHLFISKIYSCYNFKVTAIYREGKVVSIWNATDILEISFGILLANVFKLGLGEFNVGLEQH